MQKRPHWKGTYTITEIGAVGHHHLTAPWLKRSISLAMEESPPKSSNRLHQLPKDHISCSSQQQLGQEHTSANSIAMSCPLQSPPPLHQHLVQIHILYILDNHYFCLIIAVLPSSRIYLIGSITSHSHQVIFSPITYTYIKHSHSCQALTTSLPGPCQLVSENTHSWVTCNNCANNGFSPTINDAADQHTHTLSVCTLLLLTCFFAAASFRPIMRLRVIILLHAFSMNVLRASHSLNSE